MGEGEGGEGIEETGEGEQPGVGGSAGINKQVTAGALQRLELPQRGSVVSGIASAVSLTFERKKKTPPLTISP